MNKIKIDIEFRKAFDFHLNKNFVKAESLYKNILKKNSSHFDTLRHLGILYQDQQMFEIAEKYYMKAYKANSAHFSIYNNLGTIKFLQFKMDEALEFYKKAFKINPKFVPVINNISAFYHRQFRDKECMKFSKLALSLEPNNLTSRINYAKALSIGNKPNEAIKIFKDVLRIQPDANNYKNLATAYRNTGNLKESYECFEEAIKYDPSDTGAFFNLSASKLNKPNKEMLVSFEKKLKLSSGLVYPDKAAIAFALYNNYNKLKNYEKASKFLLSGNKLLDTWINADINDEEFFFNEIISIYSKNYVDKNQLKDVDDKVKSSSPIFILGMPRSGTTLCEQILSSHSLVFGGGELQNFIEISEIGQTTNVNKNLVKLYKEKLNKMSNGDLNNKRAEYTNYLEQISNKHKYVTDKMPHNFILIGFIKMLYPKAKIIYCQRDRMDNCFSLYTHKFVDKSHGYCYNQKILGKYYDLHLKLMRHWLNIFKDEIYVLNHEKLLDNQEKYSKEMLQYCDLKWEPACLEFYKTEREVQTASNEQVREPINKKSVSAWKKYENVLGPLKKYLERKND
jgi:Tfp pilus assembly protein PilF